MKIWHESLGKGSPIIVKFFKRGMDFQHCLWKTILNYTQVAEDIWGGREWEGSNNHTKSPPSQKKEDFVLNQNHFPKNPSTRIQGDMTKLLHCLQVVKPRCRQSAFSLCEAELILHQPVTEEIYTLCQKCQEKEHHLNYTFFFVGLGFFLFLFVLLGVVCFVFSFEFGISVCGGCFFKTITVFWHWCFGKPFTSQPWKMHVTNCRIKTRKPCMTFFS